MFGSFTALFTAIAESFKSLGIIKEHQSESNALSTLKRKTKAVEYAEKIIFLVDKTDFVSDKTYQKLRKNFFKYN